MVYKLSMSKIDIKILKDTSKALKRNYKRLAELRAELKEFDHDCRSGPDDGCQICYQVDNADYVTLLNMKHEIEAEKQEIADDHISGDEPGIACSDCPREYMGDNNLYEYASQPF